MDLAFTDDQRAIQELFHGFAEREIRPRAQALDEQPEFPRELFAQAAELGFFGFRYPEPEGSGADVLSYVLAVEELAWGSLAVAATCCMQSLMGTYFVHAFAPPEIKARLFAGMLRGEILGTICMTEPGAGTDLKGISTRAVEVDGTWRLSGQKTWITSAPVADVFTVFAKSGTKEDAGELSVFLVEKGAPGLVVGKSIEKLGVKASLTSEVFLEDTPATCMLGGRGGGGASLQVILAEVRLMTAALSLGIGRAAYEEALAYSREREQFGRPIGKFQGIRFHLADMATELEAARRLTYWAAWRSDQGLENKTQASMAKLFASETASRVCDKAARVMASYGFANESPVQRYLRDVRFLLIGGGTSEILKVNIARGL